MNYKLVEGHAIHECAKFQGILLSHLATKGLRIVKKCKNKENQRKIKLTSSIFIIYLHNELQSCRGSWNLLVCKISRISIFAFDHQGSSNCQKMQKNKQNQRKIKLTSSMFIIYLHNELQSCRGSWNLLVWKISGISNFTYWPPGVFKLSKNAKKQGKSKINQTNIFPVHNLPA